MPSASSGPSAAGKSTLARLIVGAIRPTHGSVRLDGAETWTWDRADFGALVGYVSQNVELFEGTIAENIARFRQTDSLAIVAAARLAGVHEMILSLPKGYETVLDAIGRAALRRSAPAHRAGARRVRRSEARRSRRAQLQSRRRRRGGAARPCLSALKARGTTVLMIAHRPSILVALDKVLVLRNGTVSDFGLSSASCRASRPASRSCRSAWRGTHETRAARPDAPRAADAEARSRHRCRGQSMPRSSARRIDRRRG